jgi:circadian clock protein KaiB
MPGQYTYEVIDLMQNPASRRRIRSSSPFRPSSGRLPAPLRKIIGDLSDEERTLVGLQLRPRK